MIAKALGRVEELERPAAAVRAKIAKSERDLRLTREYISKAAEYNLPVAPEELGPVLYRMAETMSYDDCAVIAKCLETAGEIIFEETGYTGGGDNADIYSQVEAHAYDTFGKAEDFNAVSAIKGVRPESGRLRRVPAPRSGTGRKEGAHGLRREPPVHHAGRGRVHRHLHRGSRVSPAPLIHTEASSTTS